MAQPAAFSPFPRAALFAAGGVMLAAVVFATVGRVEHIADPLPQADVVVARDVRFVDQADGGIAIYSGTRTEPVQIVQPTTDNFLRATMRTLARERMRESIGQDIPFRLTAWSDRRLTLDDPATGRHIEFEAFGETNEAVFAQVLTAAAKAP